MDIYDEIGVTRVINASGSMTFLGGSLMAPEVIEAMDRAARSFVRVDELMRWAGEEIARLTGAEAGQATTGSAGGILLAAAACLTGQDREKMQRLPDTTGMKNEFVVQKLHRISFDHAVRAAGGRLVEVGSREGTQPREIEAAIGAHTAAVFHVALDPQPTVPLAAVVEIAHGRGVPVIVDAAAELPPVENLHAFIEAGADLVIFSGGKQISGPNDSGILCGREDLIRAAAMQSFPNSGIGRPLKVGKEQIVGLVFALRRFAALDHDAEMRRWRALAEAMRDRLQGIEGLVADVAFPQRGARPLCIPKTRLQLDAEKLGRSVGQVLAELDQGSPAVVVSAEPRLGVIWLNPQHLLDGEEEVVVQRVREALGQ